MLFPELSTLLYHSPIATGLRQALTAVYQIMQQKIFTAKTQAHTPLEPSPVQPPLSKRVKIQEMHLRAKMVFVHIELNHLYAKKIHHAEQLAEKNERAKMLELICASCDNSPPSSPSPFKI